MGRVNLPQQLTIFTMDGEIAEIIEKITEWDLDYIEDLQREIEDLIEGINDDAKR